MLSGQGNLSNILGLDFFGRVMIRPSWPNSSSSPIMEARAIDVAAIQVVPGHQMVQVMATEGDQEVPQMR